MFSYTVIRSNRKTVGLRVCKGVVEFRVPHDVPQWEIDCFLIQEASWIVKTIERQEAQMRKKEAFSIDYGSTIQMRGNAYEIKKCEGGEAGFNGEAFYIPSGLTPQHIKAEIIKIYKMLAKAYIPDRVALFAAQMGLTPLSIKVSNAMRIWGSCSSYKTLNFTWRLIMTDDSCIDYLAVHELAHLVEMNHSPRYWAVVAKAMPDYKERKAKLKDFQRRISYENWTTE